MFNYFYMFGSTQSNSCLIGWLLKILESTVEGLQSGLNPEGTGRCGVRFLYSPLIRGWLSSSLSMGFYIVVSD